MAFHHVNLLGWRNTTIMQSFFVDSVSPSSALGRGILNFRLHNRVKNDGTQFKQGYYIVGSPILVRFIAELHARCEAPLVGWAPQLRKFCNLPIRENLVITWLTVHRASDRPSTPQAYQCKITQSIGMATQMQLKVLFGRKSHDHPNF